MPRSRTISIDNDHPLNVFFEPDKVQILVLDGFQGKAKLVDAVEHGFTIIETAKGKAAKIKFEESELF